jgi:predicted GNAT superfamily acetyltransferase
LANERILVRALDQPAQYIEAVRIQKMVWNFDDIDLVPPRLFRVTSDIGGHTAGAFLEDRMVGFCLAFPGLKFGRGYLHSHMVGVLPEFRNAEVGRKLKFAQREFALAHQLDLIEWTFDPLELKNAYFNIVRLGAIVRRLTFNQYGVTSSPLHGGLPTDRCTAEWWISKPRVETPVTHRIAVPGGIGELKQSDPVRAREIQKRVSDQLAECFHRDLAVIGFERSGDAGVYLLGPWESK